MTLTWISPEFTQRLAGSLIHFLWQGAAIAAVAAIGLRILARKSAESRYAISCGALAAMLAAPLLTFVFYAQTGAISLRLLQVAGTTFAERTELAVNSATTTAWTNWIVALWSLGVVTGSVHMGMGWIATRRLLALRGDEVPASIHHLFESIRDWMAIGRPFRLLVHSSIEAPAVIGYLRPVILLPVSAIRRLTERQLRAVFAHELAHIRRHDFLINVMQRCLEAILFYHPAVWWLSARVRIEREHCCDDLAVQLCGDRLVYAEALLELERSRLPVPAFSVAAAATGLTERVHRILGRHAVRYEWQSIVAVVATIAAWCFIGASQSTTVQAVPVVPENPAPPVPASEPRPAAAGKPQEATTLNAIAAILTAQQPAAAQPIGTGASIEGTVVKAGTSQGLAGANVELTQLSAKTGNVAPPKLIVSDAAGKFAFRDLSEGGYRLVADLPLTEYQPGEYGQKTPRSRGVTIRVAGSQKMENLRIEMVATGAIAGRITGARGEPIARARVVAMEMIYRNGESALNILQSVQTDDLGQYRLFWLSPGKYFIGARTSDITRKTILVQMTAPGRTGTFEEISAPVIRHKTAADGDYEETDRMVYYGNTVEPIQALSIDVASGSTREGINISLATGITRALRVRGVIVNGSGAAPSQAGSIRLVPRNWTADTIVPNTTTDAQGFFEVAGVTPGSYALYASVPSAAGPLSGRLPIEVGNVDLEKLRVTVVPNVEVQGRVTIESANDNIQLSTVRVSLVRDPDLLALSPQGPTGVGNRGGIGSNGALGPDGSFRLTAPAGDYRLNVIGLPKGTYVQSAQWNQENILATGIHVDATAVGPIQIRLATDVGKVEGSAINDRREPASNATVVLVPDAGLRRQKNLFKAVTTDVLGRFNIDDVPPGNYKLFGWDHVTEGAWENEAFMRTVESRGKTITVTTRSTTTLDGLPIPR